MKKYIIEIFNKKNNEIIFTTFEFSKNKKYLEKKYYSRYIVQKDEVKILINECKKQENQLKINNNL